LETEEREREAGGWCLGDELEMDDGCPDMRHALVNVIGAGAAVRAELRD
jgi:hypothetical protein